jgi:5-formyltetrahydrofolate cyclo-ligase
MTLTKQDLRDQAKRHRLSLRPDMEDADNAAKLFFEHVDIKPGQTVALYWPKKDEFSTQLILEDLLARDIICALPVVQKDDRALKFARWQKDDPLQESAFKVHEPVVNAHTEWVEPDIVIVPLIAFDRRGHRLGYGAGHYDATLSRLRKIKDILAVGIAFDAQLVLFPLPAEEHDQPLDLVITPQSVYRFEADKGNE